MRKELLSVPGAHWATYHQEGIEERDKVGHASRSRLHLEELESKMAIKAKAEAFRSTYLDIGL